ncbi:MAG: amino acid decarboxylase [Melioribacteraceae bacterium]|nr:amino acid decarboxylase [Melioribacteraceae bacterium]MCF8356233.1 amino acid decarboxylase [Melioribacteraceae bacterium]MCF8394996.1 amino acid decarboxylase [Melioribacteraceae bacterium]MCF8419716.1 amino acid decarboxylase [Melioribacteraceae bacterium]
MSNITRDMSGDDFKKYGYELVDWIANYLSDLDNIPVLPDIVPGDIEKKLPTKPPFSNETMQNILADIDKIVMPGMTHWNHPYFNAYFNSTASSAGILAEFLSAAFNVNGMVWKSAPASNEIEKVTVDWMRQMLGLPDSFWGIIYDTASVSSMHAIASAREDLKGMNIRELGMSGRTDLPLLRVYSSEQAHSSIDKGAIILGLGLKSLVKIPVNEKFEMLPDKFEEAILQDKEEGYLPMCAVATIGTTSTTSVDPVKQIAEICKRHYVWLHVDAAHAGPIAMLDDYSSYFDGWEEADSIVMNPHKWMFVPIDLSLLFTKHKGTLKSAFSLVHEYLKTTEDDKVDNLMDYGIQLGRRFRSLKLWFVIRYFGVEGIKNILREHLRMGKNFSDWIESHPVFEKLAPTPFSTICFRAKPPKLNEDELNDFNQQLIERINAKRKLFITHSKLNGKFTIRYVVSGIRTHDEHVEKAKQIIEDELHDIMKDWGLND